MSTRKERAEKTQKRILREAIDLFSSQGYLNTTMDQIADKAEVAKGTVYLHFGNKDRLALNIIKDLSDSFIEILDQLAEKNQLTTDQIMHVVLDQMEDGIGIVQLLFGLYLDKTVRSDKSEIEKVSREFLDPIYEKMSLIFHKLGYENPVLHTRIFFATLDGIGLQLSLESRWDNTELVSDLFSYIANLLVSGKGRN